MPWLSVTGWFFDYFRPGTCYLSPAGGSVKPSIYGVVHVAPISEITVSCISLTLCLFIPSRKTASRLWTYLSLSLYLLLPVLSFNSVLDRRPSWDLSPSPGCLCLIPVFGSGSLSSSSSLSPPSLCVCFFLLHMKMMSSCMFTGLQGGDKVMWLRFYLSAAHGSCSASCSSSVFTIYNVCHPDSLCCSTATVLLLLHFLPLNGFCEGHVSFSDSMV